MTYKKESFFYTSELVSSLESESFSESLSISLVLTPNCKVLDCIMVLSYSKSFLKRNEKCRITYYLASFIGIYHLVTTGFDYISYHPLTSEFLTPL